ncbi:hypothetical protein ANAPH1_00110 [Anaplasma phagocytophilum]|nr:hypothetical protein ANAPH1_00110 [Anaplasma phagocytophilum]
MVLNQSDIIVFCGIVPELARSFVNQETAMYSELCNPAYHFVPKCSQFAVLCWKMLLHLEQALLPVCSRKELLKHQLVVTVVIVLHLRIFADVRRLRKVEGCCFVDGSISQRI